MMHGYKKFIAHAFGQVGPQGLSSSLPAGARRKEIGSRYISPHTNRGVQFVLFVTEQYRSMKEWKMVNFKLGETNVKMK